jgi:flavin reductase (DIM6/NTAB) family NADH-FMN oxidoreductase RutF
MFRGRLVPMDTLTSELDYPMVIVTTVADGERSGCLVGFHTQCSIDPARWAVWISKANHTHRVAQRASMLAVHFLSVDDRDLAELFGEETGDEVDKFAHCEWTEGPDGVPVLDQIPNRFVGRVRDTLEDDCDHQCFIVDMADVEHQHPLRQLGFQAARGLEPGHPA